MIEIFAPHPSYAESIVLPNPEKGNTMKPVSLVKRTQAMDGTNYTYVQKKDNAITYSFSFILTRQKFLAFKLFYETYCHQYWKIENYNSKIIIGICLSDELQGSAIGRALYCPELATGSFEDYSVTFEFEGTET